MTLTTFIGFAAAFLATASFLPQAIKCWKTKKTKDLSLPAYLMLTIGVFLWMIYGFLIKDIPVFVANLISFIINLSIVILKLKYG